MNDYVQKVVWIGTVLGDASTDDFEKFFLKELGFHVKYDGEFKMVGGHYDGLNCIVFNLHNDDVSKFAMFRITTDDMKWLEDFFDNEGVNNFPEEFHENYSNYLSN